MGFDPAILPGDALLGTDHCPSAEGGQDGLRGGTWQLHPRHCEDAAGG